MSCFSKAQRLLKKADYDYVFAQAKRLTTQEFTILYRDNSLGFARLGLALSKKIVPKAHERNRIKRLLREVFRITNLPSVDIIVLARHGVADIENKLIVAKLGTVWNKLIGLYAR